MGLHSTFLKDRYFPKIWKQISIDWVNIKEYFEPVSVSKIKTDTFIIIDQSLVSQYNGKAPRFFGLLTTLTNKIIPSSLLHIASVSLFVFLLPLYSSAQTISALECQNKERKGRVVAGYTGSTPVSGSTDAESLKQIVVLEHIESNINKDQPIKPPTDIWLNLPQPMAFLSPIDCDIQYECTGANFYLQAVKQPDIDSVINRLNQLTNTPMYGCYEIENDFENKQSQTRCRFLRKITIDDKAFQGEAGKLVKNWATDLKGEKIVEFWLEGGERVDSKGLPLEKLCSVRPVAIKTDKNFYLFIEEVRASAEFARQIIVTGQRLFSFVDSSDLRSSTINVMNIFGEELEKNFKSDPLLADRSLDARVRAGEWVFKRDHQKSRVISREIWFGNLISSAYEISTYTFKWFSTGNRELTSSVEHGFFGKGAEQTVGQNVFIEVEHVFLLAADGVNYRETIEPKAQMDSYLALYRRAVSEAFKKALRNTCYGRLAGRGILANGVCEIRGDVR